MRPLRLFSYNVRGLASRTRRVRARLILDGLQCAPDVTCLQEHKLRAGRTDRILKEVWKKAHWVFAPASEGVHARRNNLVEAGKGGLALGIHTDLASYITKEGVANDGRAAWACLDHPAWGCLGFVGI